MSDESEVPAAKYLVVRSSVEAGRAHGWYKQTLRRDFCYACAYCTMAEIESAAVGYEIDHYQPQEADGTDEYSNLYWSCHFCNSKKKHYWPDSTQYAAGYRFLRVDLENPEEHIGADQNDPTHVAGRTEVGRFTISYLGLNFARMIKLRKIRQDAGYSMSLMRQGLRALSSMRLDELPPNLKTKAIQMNERLRRTADEIEGALDSVLRQLAEEHSKSDLLDVADDRAELKEREKYLRGHGVLKPKAPKKKT